MHEHDDTGDKLEHAYFCYLADKFEREPELLRRAQATVQRWLSIDHHGAKQLLEWQQLMASALETQSGMARLCEVLRADDENTRFLKGFAPFPGLLSRTEKTIFMRFSSLKHLAASVSAIAPEASIIVFGSSSALCTHPNLPEVTDSYEQTLDADFILDPWDQSLGNLLTETLGKDSGFFEHYKYYADIVRPAAFDNFPPDFRDRLVASRRLPAHFCSRPTRHGRG